MEIPVVAGRRLSVFLFFLCALFLLSSLISYKTTTVQLVWLFINLHTTSCVEAKRSNFF